jgi:hypothetical protein
MTWPEASYQRHDVDTLGKGEGLRDRRDHEKSVEVEIAERDRH